LREGSGVLTTGAEGGKRNLLAAGKKGKKGVEKITSSLNEEKRGVLQSHRHAIRDTFGGICVGKVKKKGGGGTQSLIVDWKKTRNPPWVREIGRSVRFHQKNGEEKKGGKRNKRGGNSEAQHVRNGVGGTSKKGEMEKREYHKESENFDEQSLGARWRRAGSKKRLEIDPGRKERAFVVTWRETAWNGERWVAKTSQERGGTTTT